ncbi:MAG TPA: glycosyltransferase family 4 protein [Candidatus Binatus sp.]|nr:glycosyltransferase family 4 protein [Candidatus Binatus sp.]
MNILMSAGVPRRHEGGVAAIVYNFGRELESRGHRVEYLFYEDLLSEAEMKGRFRDLRFSLRVARHIRKNRDRYSVVNLHAPIGFVYGLSRWIFPSSGYPPYVMTLHGLVERFVRVMAREDEKGKAWHFSLKNRLWYRIYHRPRFVLAIKTLDRAHCYSRDVWTMLQLKYNLDSDKVAYIPNGVEKRFFISRENHDRKPLRLLYAGTWLDQRGIFYLRDALNGLNKRFKDWTLTIVGAGFPAVELESFFGAGLREQIIILPIVPAKDMQHVYGEYDIFVFPSLMEGLPSVILESMAAGMAVITTETCGMADVVEDGFNGLLIPPANAEAIEDAILRLAQSPSLRQQLGQAAQESMKRLTWEKSAEKLEKVFEVSLRNGSGMKTTR